MIPKPSLQAILDGPKCLVPNAGVAMPSCHEHHHCDCVVTILAECLQKAVEAMEMGAFHHSSCNANLYDDHSIRENWDGKGDHRNAQPCTCAHYKIDLALAEINERIAP